MQMARFYLGLLAVGLLLTTNALGQEEEQEKETVKVAIGGAAPDFELTDAEGKQHKLSDYKDKIVVLEWLNKDCPVSNHETGAGKKMKELAEKYAKSGIVWLGIDSTHFHEAADVAKYAKEHEIPYPILMDRDGKVGKAYQARTTPHIFIINKGTLVYMGAHDSKKVDQKGTRNYIAEALDALLAGKEVQLAKTQPYGCAVKYKR